MHLSGRHSTNKVIQALIHKLYLLLHACWAFQIVVCELLYLLLCLLHIRWTWQEWEKESE